MILAIEIGGTKLQTAIGTPEGEILESHRADSPSEGGASAILEWFEREIPSILDQAKQDGADIVPCELGETIVLTGALLLAPH